MTTVSQILKIDAPISMRLLESLLELDQAVLDAVPMGIYACDADGLILRANRKAAELWGRMPSFLDPAQRFCGSFRLQTFEGQVIPPEQSPMARAVRHGESAKGLEAVVFNPDGRRWVARVHVEPMRSPGGDVIGAINCFQDVTEEYEMRLAAERRQLTFDLAMVASDMGTWRYTFADNICVYDDNAQRLYGLSEANFLHDEQGVKAKFHPDDLDLMWARVAKALDPHGDGRYDVEYRVKQLDGGWRWLSAWGVVEFEGYGEARKPVAIAGASRDLTGRKKAEELQRLLLNELDHRVKNTLGIVQSLTSQTLRTSSDLASAGKALEARIMSLAQAHDLLTQHSWAGADLQSVIARAMQPFEAGQIRLSGPSILVSPRHVLALSLTLHELATNAAKYGALSCAEGNLNVHWEIREGCMHLRWRETKGPQVVPPTRRGFGSRLLEAGVLRDLGGKVNLDYLPSGLHCDITASLSHGAAAEQPYAGQFAS